jgi:dihydroneopterin aldolase
MPVIKQRVALEGIRFYAFHGFYPEEQKIGNEFVLDISTESNADKDFADELTDTVNYERLFEIAAEEMKAPRKLLETVAHAILVRIVSEFPKLETAKVSIRKLNLPLKGEVKNSRVELSYTK